MQNVAILHGVLRAFQAHLARLLRPLLAAGSDEIRIGDGLGADETFLEVGVNDARGLRRLRALRHCPGMRFLRSHGEEGDEIEEPIARANDAREPGLLEAERPQKIALLRFVGELRDLGLDGGGNDDAHRALRTRIIGNACRLRIAARRRGLFNVADIENGFGADQLQALEDRLLLRLQRHDPRGLPLAQGREYRFHDVELRLRLLVVAARLLLRGDDAPLEALEIGQQKLGLDRLRVADRVDRAFDMRDVSILEAAQHMRYGIDLADVAKKLIAQSLAARRTADEAGDVDEFELCRNDLRGFRQPRAYLEPLIRHRDAADIRLYRTKGVICRFCRGCRGERVEERRLPHIGQADDAAIETHVTPCCPGFGSLAARGAVWAGAVSGSAPPSS